MVKFLILVVLVYRQTVIQYNYSLHSNGLNGAFEIHEQALKSCFTSSACRYTELSGIVWTNYAFQCDYFHLFISLKHEILHISQW